MTRVGQDQGRPSNAHSMSDGEGTIKDMATEALELGYQYIGITHHTQGLKIAGGLNEQRLEKQAKEIATLNRGFKKQGVTILKSAEVNLSPAGEGDMKSSALKKLDVVLGCFQSALRTTDDQTDRYLAGLRNPDIQILGHPQTRVYDKREGLKADWHRVFAGMSFFLILFRFRLRDKHPW